MHGKMNAGRYGTQTPLLQGWPSAGPRPAMTQWVSQEVGSDCFREVQFEDLPLVAAAILNLPHLRPQREAHTASCGYSLGGGGEPHTLACAAKSCSESRCDSSHDKSQGAANPVHATTQHRTPQAAYTSRVAGWVSPTCVHSRIPSALTRSAKLVVLPPTPK